MPFHMQNLALLLFPRSAGRVLGDHPRSENPRSSHRYFLLRGDRAEFHQLVVNSVKGIAQAHRVIYPAPLIQPGDQFFESRGFCRPLCPHVHILGGRVFRAVHHGEQVTRLCIGFTGFRAVIGAARCSNVGARARPGERLRQPLRIVNDPRPEDVEEPLVQLPHRGRDRVFGQLHVKLVGFDELGVVVHD